MITGMLSPQISYYPENLNFKYKNEIIIDGRNIHQIFKAFDILVPKFLGIYAIFYDKHKKYNGLR